MYGSTLLITSPCLILNLLFRNKRSVANKTRIIKVGKKLIKVRKNDAARNNAHTKSMYAG